MPASARSRSANCSTNRGAGRGAIWSCRTMLQHSEVAQTREVCVPWVQVTTHAIETSAAWSSGSAGSAPSTDSTSRCSEARCTASSDPTARASPPPSGCCSACCAPQRRAPTLLGGDPWRDATHLHRRLAYVPGDVNLWPQLTGGEVIDLLGRLRGDLDADPQATTSWSGSSSTRARRRAPTPRATGRRSRWSPPWPRGRAAHPGRAHLRPRPADGGGVPGVHPRRCVARAGPCCCRATSSPRSRRCATG